MKKCDWVILGFVLGVATSVCIVAAAVAFDTKAENYDISEPATTSFEFEPAIIDPEPIEIEPPEPPEYERYLPGIQASKKQEPEWICPISDDDIWLLGLVCVAESEDQTELGKRLVIDTVLNRVDSSEFPDTINGVVYQKGQFSSMWNGRADRCVVTDEYRDLVIEELKARTNSEVLYFRTGRYSSWGSPLFKEDDHYFSK